MLPPSQEPIGATPSKPRFARQVELAEPIAEAIGRPRDRAQWRGAITRRFRRHHEAVRLLEAAHDRSANLVRLQFIGVPTVITKSVAAIDMYGGNCDGAIAFLKMTGRAMLTMDDADSGRFHYSVKWD